MPGYIIKARAHEHNLQWAYSAPFELAVIPTGSFHETLNFPPA